MTPEARTLLSVRGDAVQTVAPDEAVLYCSLSAVGDTKAHAVAAVGPALEALTTELGSMGGHARSADNARRCTR